MSMLTTSRDELKIMSTEYTIESDGHIMEEPIVQLFCRDADQNYVEREVEGFYPHFYIKADEYVEKEKNTLNENFVRHVEVPASLYTEDRKDNPSIKKLDSDEEYTNLHEESVVKVVTVLPKHLSTVRKQYDDHYQGDVYYTNSFLIATGVKDGISIPEGKERVHIDEVWSCEAPDVKPRVGIIDIEVLTDDGEFPEPKRTPTPVTSVTGWDSYTGEYVAWILRNQGWDVLDGWNLPKGVESCDIRVFDTETGLLEDCNQWMISKRFDILSGWNSSRNEKGNGFDYPYWINRCYDQNVWSVQKLSPVEKSFVTDRGTAIISGVEVLDMMQAYMKTQIHQKKSYALGYISEEELGYGKEDITNTDDGWKNHPVDFLQYNIRDVQAVAEIEDNKNILEMYDHIRQISGNTYSQIADSNFDIIDMLLLREARKRGMVLTTSRTPTVEHYWGAYVFTPQKGLHKNVTYPDLSSLYPNLFKDMNASPETIIGFEDDLENSEYSKDDCYVLYVDRRSEEEKKDADEPERSELYVLKPDVKTSFVRDIITDLIDMKYEYKKDEYADEAYGAVKRVTNSVYGYFGDSNTRGKGSRMFDWRIAEAITLAGRDVIKYTASEFNNYAKEQGYADAEIIAGDTDSCVCSIPSADGTYTNGNISELEAEQYLSKQEDIDLSKDAVNTSRHETLTVAMKAAAHVDSSYQDFMKDRFNISDQNMAVEIESYARTAFFMDTKKRYAQNITWDEGDYVDEVEVKGFELVRSDSSEITTTAQKKVLEILLKSDSPKSEIKEYLNGLTTDVANGEYPLEDVGIPSAMTKQLEEYGSKSRTPMPHIRGAKYANQNIKGEDIGAGSKPLLFYVEKVGPGLPGAYTAETRENENKVDAIAISNVENMPKEITVDYEKMMEKVLKKPIEPILNVMDWKWEDITSSGAQAGLENFM